MLITFIIYLVVMLLIGGVATLRARSRDDFILAGRQLGPFAAALSASATSMSGWLFMGLPGKVLQVGLSAAWIAVGCILGDYANWRLTCARLRKQSDKLSALTLPEFITGCRQDRLAKLTRLLAGLAIVVFITIYLCAQLVATGKTLSGPLGLGDYAIDYRTAVLIGASVIILYTSLGGFVAVVWTDVIQSLIMCLALIGLPIYCVFLVISQGNGAEIWTQPTLDDPNVAMGSLWGAPGSGMGVMMAMSIFVMLIDKFGVGAGYLGQPQIASRFMALRDERDSKIARRIGVSWTAITALGAVTVALCAPLLISELPDDPEQILLVMTREHFPGWLSGVVIAALMAAVMSSADSFLMSAVSSIQQDFPGPLRAAARSPWVTRAIIIALGVAATWYTLSIDPNDESNSVLNLAQQGWAGLSIALAVPVLYCLGTERSRTGVVLLTMLLGIGMMILWQLTGLSNHVYEVIPCLAAQTLVCFLAHRWPGTPSEPPEEAATT